MPDITIAGIEKAQFIRWKKATFFKMKHRDVVITPRNGILNEVRG